MSKIINIREKISIKFLFMRTDGQNFWLLIIMAQDAVIGLHVRNLYFHIIE